MGTSAAVISHSVRWIASRGTESIARIDGLADGFGDGGGESMMPADSTRVDSTFV